MLLVIPQVGDKGGVWMIGAMFVQLNTKGNCITGY